MQNFLDPAILFFVFGVVAGLLRSDLEVPQPISKFLSLYLMMAIGLKGGFALAASGLGEEDAWRRLVETAEGVRPRWEGELTQLADPLEVTRPEHFGGPRPTDQLDALAREIAEGQAALPGRERAAGARPPCHPSSGRRPCRRWRWCRTSGRARLGGLSAWCSPRPRGRCPGAAAGGGRAARG